MEDFKLLIIWAEELPQRVEELKKVLRLNQNYLEARDHCMLAVGKDNRLRFWTNANVSHAGALFSANLGSIELDHPAGTPLYLLRIPPGTCMHAWTRNRCAYRKYCIAEVLP